MTRLIGPASPFIRTDVDVAFDADLNDPAESWSWTTLGDYTDGARTRPRVLNQTIEVFHGRRDESALADPSTVEVELGNGDGALTPQNPASPYYPGLKRGTPLRVMVTAGSPFLLFTGLSGSRVTTPDAAALDITGDFAGAVQFRSPVAVGPVGLVYKVMAKWAAGQRSYRLVLAADGTVRLRWSTDGSNELEAQSSLALPRPETGPLTVAWELDVNNLASGNTTTWYVGRVPLDTLLADPDAYEFGDPWINSGTTSIHPGTAVLDLGDNTGSGFPAYPGGIDRLQLRSGTLSGSIVADLDAPILAPGATGTTDSAGRVWTFNTDLTNRHPRFCGRVDKVTTKWGEIDETNPLLPNIAYAQVSASGILERLAQEDAIGSALRRFLDTWIASGGVVAAWMFEDGREATRAAQLVSGAAPMNIRGSFSFAGDTSYPAVEQQLTIGSGDNAYMSAPIPQIPQVVGVNWAVTRFFRIDEPVVSPGAPTQLMAVDTNGEVATWRLAIDDTQIAITGSDIDGTGVVLATFSADARMFDTEAMIVLEVTDDGANVDWEVTIIPIPLGVGFGTSGTFAGNTGVPRTFRNSCTGPPSGISLGPLIVSTGLPIGWLAPADTAYIGEPASARVFRLCRERGIPVAVDGLYVGSSSTTWAPAIAAGAKPMGPQRPGKLVDLLQECADVDFGLLGEMRGSLGLTYRSGVSLQSHPVKLSLARSDRTVVDPFEEVDDDQHFVNDVTATRTDGSSYRVEDPAIAAGTEERYEQTVEVNTQDDLMLPDQAGWRHHIGTWPEPRYPQVWSDIAKNTDLVDDVIGFGVGDRFTVTDPPPGCPPVDQLADGIVEELERFQWRIGLNGRPARPWDTAIVDDGDFGRVDTAGSETTGSFTSGTSTSMTVATTLGPLWATSVAEFPFDIEVEGVRLRVTAISGASSPQTFTITQAPVNGVEKTIPAGAEVRLWQGAVVAF